MKSPLGLLYAAVEVLAGLSMVAILVLILAGVAFRIDGRQLAGSDDLSGYCLVAVFFLALAPTYRRGEHIRVGMLVNRLTGATRQRVELVLVAVATVCSGWATWWLGRMVYDSWRFNDMAQGLIPVPLWIPQSLMVVGTAILFVALAEDLVRTLPGGKPSYLAHADAEAADTPVFER
ncbi:hypothetical protein COL154_014320 [Colletotrichum chrysophilum]|nr:hypothetical protein COL154_014320 [Colletotrichum chrysophilum]